MTMQEETILTREELDKREIERQHFELSEIQQDCQTSAILDYMAKHKEVKDEEHSSSC